MLNHLLHRALLQELAILVANDAILFVLTAVGICAKDFIGERHSAALTEFLFHVFFLVILIHYFRHSEHQYCSTKSRTSRNTGS